ncbi:hypothetical protein HTV45_25485 [Streptomyces sp. CHD11]|uniref:hypothetical protein n=1 Tax=Streptomyces sp. CHD11 TaxID=2741325 RepID=UPI001BFC59E5|nr:hypothetical protein [Streptomyces sp. CHD11]MBT3154183.1 hypothetical protein [Streptomyces sp. CHD11]
MNPPDAAPDGDATNPHAAYTLGELRRLDPAVRADILCVLDRVARDLPAHWSRRKGVPQLMVFPDGHGDARVERTSLREMAEYGYLDELHRWVRGVPAAKAREHGCAALVYGNRIHARINRIGPFGAPRFAPDTHVAVCVAHRDVPMAPDFSLTFDTVGRFLPRLVFHDWVAETLDRARRI